MAEREVAPEMQIFATDIDEHAVGIARIGRYGKMVPGMSPERLERWFTEDGDHYRPIKEIRDTCIFSVNSFVKDPPFSTRSEEQTLNSSQSYTPRMTSS